MHRTTAFFTLLLLSQNLHAEDVPPLPLGSHPAALRFGHFPDAAHAVVFRNWRLVAPERIAKTLETDGKTVAEMARSMGLPPAGEDWREMERRGYITVVRRNWHLLPYEQLLTLTGLSQQELWFALKEDDFLFVKLGNLKPKCERVVFRPPDRATQRRVAEIRETVEKHFARLFAEPSDPRFSFIERLSQPSGEAPRASAATRGPRYVYSYFGAFGDPLANPELDPYPNGLLERLAAQGVNGVWLHTVLRQLAPGGPDFPEFGEGWERRLKTLREFVGRARQYGIGIYLYVNEPRAMPSTFFKDRPEIAGVRKDNSVTLCTSHPRVRRWLADSLAHVFREVPGLAGVFTITASENLTNCVSHFKKEGCARCAPRTEAEIISEVVATIEEGVHRSNPKAHVIAWDWGWNRHQRSPETIIRLPKSVWLMSVSEWSLPIERGGVRSEVGEYSISSPGPGPRATFQWQTARARGLKTAAKVQFNTTWELASVPWLPVLDLVAEHCARLAAQKVDGTMLSWTVGGYPSPNLQVAARFAENADAEPSVVLDAIAAKRYGSQAAPWVRRAWSAFSEAFREYPYHIETMYKGPQQIGATNLLYPEPTGFTASMVGIPYDDLDGWRGPYPRDVFASQFHRMARGWKEGVTLLARAVKLATEEKSATATGDLRLARAAGIHFSSVANQVRYIIGRDRLVDKNLSRSDRRAVRKQLRAIAADEIRLAREQFALSWVDARLGFEATNHYFYTPLDAVEKVLNCEQILRGLERDEAGEK